MKKGFNLKHIVTFLVLCLTLGLSSIAASASTYKNYYGNQLTGESAQTYKALMAHDWNQSSQAAMTLDNSFSWNTDAELQAFVEKLQKGIDAFLKDNTEYQDVATFQYAYRCSVSNGTYSISQVIFSKVEYYNGMSQERSEVNTALAAAYRTIEKNRVNSSRYETAKAIHDYVADLITYRSGNGRQIYTINGALLNKYNNSGVCEAYSKLFRQLCDHYDIPCILVSGCGRNSASTALVSNHMWNLVQMENGNWYLVDVTWDDAGTTTRYEYFLAGSNSNGYYAKVSTDHVAMNDATPALAASKYDEETKHVTTAATVKTSKENYTVKLGATALSLQKGKKSTVKVSGLVKGDRVKAWTSSNKACVSVNSKGKITAKKAGKATITVTTVKGAKATVKVTVKNAKLALNKKSVTLKSGKKFQIKTSLKAVKMTCKSSNSKVAKVTSRGKVTALKAGKATITVKTADGQTAKLVVIVK